MQKFSLSVFLLSLFTFSSFAQLPSNIANTTELIDLVTQKFKLEGFLVGGQIPETFLKAMLEQKIKSAKSDKEDELEYNETLSKSEKKQAVEQAAKDVVTNTSQKCTVELDINQSKYKHVVLRVSEVPLAGEAFEVEFEVDDDLFKNGEKTKISFEKIEAILKLERKESRSLAEGASLATIWSDESGDHVKILNTLKVGKGFVSKTSREELQCDFQLPQPANN
jgi:hypothetical protein